MINYKSLIKSQEWLDVKSIFNSELIDKPLGIKTEGKSIEMIALEVRASQLACEKVLKIIKKVERLGNKEILNKVESWK